MLLIIIVLLVVLAVYLFYKNRTYLGIFTLIILLAGQGLLLLDSIYHFGTEQYIVTSTKRINPVTSIKGNKVLITEKLKEGKTSYTAYGTKEKSNGKTVVILNKQKQINVNFSAKQRSAYQITENKEYRYTNRFAKFIYTGITNNKQLKDQTIKYQLTSNWYRLSKAALKKLAKNLKTKTTQQKIKIYVANKIMQEVKKDPKLLSNKKKIQQLKNNFVKKYIGRMIERAAV
ncbi:DUF4811 domain-containing protein [Oenococcus sp. UCMA 16435]|nr:DUF4811 domain-containing protein [Oenococcus sp. UCMA 16435]